jgi:hypothetical protein
VDEENPTHAGLAQENGFWLSIIAMAGERRNRGVHL